MLHEPSLKTSSTSFSEQPTDADSSAKKPMPRPLKWALNFAKAGFTFGILYYLYSKGMLDVSRVRTVLTNVPVICITISILTFTNLISVVRWQMLLAGQGLPLPFMEALKLTMIGVFFNTAIPGAVSGDLIKGYYIVRKQPEKRGRIRAFTTLLLDRILGLSALILLSTVAMLLNLKEITQTPKLQPLLGLILFLFSGVVVFYILMLVRSKRMRAFQAKLVKLPYGDLIFRFFEAIKLYEDRRHLILKGLAISLCIHFSLISAFVLLSQALGGFEGIPYDKFYLLAPLGLLVTAIPIAPAGLGTGHAAFFGLFQLIGSTAGAELFTAYVSFQIFFSLVGGLFYLKYKTHQS